RAKFFQSVRLALRQANLAHHLEQAIGVGPQKPREFRPIKIGNPASSFCKTLDDGFILHEQADRVAQKARHVRRRSLRRKNPVPKDIDDLLISGLLTASARAESSAA